MESRAVLEAGGILADAESAPPDLPVDGVDARTYRHPAIAGRAVVRVVPRSLDAGADTWMATFGFALDRVGEDLGVQRRRTLGFPWWTLVHEPRHAALVLEQQPAFRKARRLAASKPGHAKDALTEIAKVFERRAPAVLPTFWEEAGRAFVDLGNPKMAATCFDKGRAAEATFGLSVDQERLGDVFLEFALAGAVTVKSLQAWAKQLSSSVGAAQAWDRFRTLAVRRTLGGMPPWASFAKDLAGLAKSAGRDVEVERRSWLAEILGAPALDRATPTFWKEHYGALAELARHDPEVRRRWLSRFPRAGASSWSDVDESFADAWLGELHRAGVLEGAWTDPEVDPARWLKALLDWAPDAYGPALSLARVVGARMAREGRVFQVDERCDVDVIDLLLELGVEVKRDEEEAWWDVRDWARGEPVPAVLGLPAEHRPRDPARIAAHPTFGPSLISAASGAVGDDGFERATATSPVMAEVRRKALHSWLERATTRALPDTDSVVDDVVDLSVQRLRDEPEIWAGLQGLDVARSLAASWRGGLVAELGWAAFDEAVEELGTEDLKVHGPWPYTVLFNPRKAIVLGPDGSRLTVIDLRLPKDVEPTGVRWIGGQLLVAWRASGEGKAVWSSDWRQPFTADVSWWDNGDNEVADLGDGTFFLGVRPFAVGEQAWPEDEHFLHDGERFWRRVDGRFLVLDPRTGRTTQGPPPSFFADIDPDGLNTALLRFVPGRGPWALRKVGERSETLDGLVWDGEALVDFLVVLPGDTRARGVLESWRDLTMYAPEGYETDEQPEDEEHPVPPVDRWHWFTPRDPAGSEALRGADTELARAVMEPLRSAEDPLVALADAFPAITHPRLRQGVVATVQRALEVERNLRDFLEERGEAPTVEPGGATIASIVAAFGMAAAGRGYWDADHDPLVSMAADAAFLAGDAESAGGMDLDWPAFGRWIRGAGHALARPGLSERHREHLLAFLRAWVELPDLVVRRASWSFPDLRSSFLKTEVEDGERHLLGRWEVTDGGRWIASTDDTWSDEGPFDVTTLTAGEAPPPGGAPEGEVTVTDTALHRDWLRALVAAAEEHGTRETLPDGAADVLAEGTGLSRAAAVLVLAAAPDLGRWQSDFLGAELRERLGLKKNEAELARNELTRLGTEKLAELLAEAAPADPGRLWSAEVAEDLARAFVARFGRRLAIPPELRAAAKKSLDGDAALDWLAAPDAAELWTKDRAYSLDDDGDVVVAEGDALTLEEIGTVQELLPWLMQQVPSGDPLLANALRLATLVEQRTAHPGLMVEAGYGWASSARKAKSLFDAMGGELVERTGDDGWARRDLGGLVVMQNDESLKAVVRTGRFDEDHLRTLWQLAEALDDEDLRHSAHVMSLLGTGRSRATMERMQTSPVPEGGHECDPRASAPELVASVRSSLKLSEAGACFFLQLLALPAPTKKAIQAWNGWSAKVYATATAELVAAELVLEAKRARAGRDHFLPGPWVDAPIPWERWKGPLLDAREQKSDVVLPRVRAVVFDPPHVLFATAWKRYADGDRPRFR